MAIKEFSLIDRDPPVVLNQAQIREKLNQREIELTETVKVTNLKTKEERCFYAHELSQTGGPLDYQEEKEPSKIKLVAMKSVKLLQRGFSASKRTFSRFKESLQNYRLQRKLKALSDYSSPQRFSKRWLLKYAKWTLPIMGVIGVSFLLGIWYSHNEFHQKEQANIPKNDQLINPFDTLENNQLIIPLSQVEDVKLEMVRIKAGDFLMGSPLREENRGNDETPHQVTLSKDFWLGKYEVTQEQYQIVMGTNPSEIKNWDSPVEKVSWQDAMAFCQKLNELTEGQRPAGYVYTLPTEAQWEYACRAGTTTPYYHSDLDQVAWYSGNAGGKTHPVGQKQPNAWGLYDMHGNVWEWCSDWYGSYSTQAVTDPIGAKNGSARVGRGGSWRGIAQNCRSAIRIGSDPTYQFSNLGFRVALALGQ